MPETLPTKVSRTLRPLFSREPFHALREEMDDLIGRFSADWGGDLFSREFSPSLDLSEVDDSLQIRMDVPGIKPEDINIEVTGNSLRISGERKEEKEEKGKHYHRLERRSGSFSRTVALPCAVKEDHVKAECHEGILTVTLPKTEKAKTHKVKVKGNGAGGSQL
jgi:HSP20 family protein